MASSSSSSSSTTPQVKHHVFLSFRGEDTRYNFISHLHEALCRKMIVTFIDNELNRGDEISRSLLNAIEGSKISVIIFSKSYAASKWCIEELVKILECKNMYEQIVIPVFYHIDPSDVRHQTGTFGNEFAELEERFKERLDMVQRWRTALSEVANLSGWPLNDNTSEAGIVKEIVNDILRRLRNIVPPSDNKKLVGVESTVKELTELLLNKDIYVLGIWGIGGIGKTTIARAIFNRISSQFQGFCFAENVREESKNPNGLVHLREKLLSTMLGDQNSNVECPITKERLGLMKILIVLDDVTDFQQIEDFFVDHSSLGSGSRIIITTRDKQVLENSRVGKIHEVKELSHPDGLHLFTQYAFELNLIPKNYLELSNKVVNYARGLPLAIKVLGSSLLHKRKEVWESVISKLQETQPLNIFKVLKISYDGLDSEEQDIFLDIACFFKWKDKDLVINILNASGLVAVEYGISVLIDKSLITISSDNTITMHDLLQKMGRKIIQEEKDISKRNRLWHHKDIHIVLAKNMGTEAIRGISLYMFEIGHIHLNPLTFSKMRNLIYLNVYGAFDNKVHGFEGLEYDFAELRYLCWHNYWSKSLPSNFNPQNLVALEMRHSNLKELCISFQNLVNLKYIDLSYSAHLLKIPDLSQALNLERLVLEGCTSLNDIIYQSIRSLNKLVILNLRNCKSLRNLPPGIQSDSLRFVILSGCSSLKFAPKISFNMKWLCLDGTSIKEFTSMINQPSRLVRLTLQNCSRLESLPRSIHNMRSLKYLSLSSCSNLKTIPEIPCKIEELYIDGTAIKELPLSIESLSNLRTLSLKNCSWLESLPNGICKLKSLKYLFLSGCSNIKAVPEISCKLEKLYLDGTGIKELPSLIGCLCSLDTLSIKNCSNLESLPSDICKLKFLRYLYISGCSKLDRLPEAIGNLKSLEVLEANGIAIKEVPSSMVRLKNLHELSFERCNGQKLLRSLPPMSFGLQFLQKLNMNDCNIKELPEDLGQLCFLEHLYLARNKFESIPASIINLSRLSSLDLRHCNVLRYLPNLPCNIQLLVADSCKSLQALSALPISSHGYYNGNLSFINCFNLDWLKLKNILNDALSNVYSDTTLWLDVEKGYSYKNPFSYMCFRGSEIPEWFDFQSNGSFIELPRGSFNHNFVGLTFCTVLTFQGYNVGTLVVECEVLLKCEDGCKKIASGSHLAWTKDHAPSSVQSDHVFLGYECQLYNRYESRELSYDTEAIIKFNVTDHREPLEYCVVKRCGVRLLFSQEVKEPINESSGCFISDEEKEQEEHTLRDPNFLITFKGSLRSR